jgi:hypothetical protein
MDPSGILNAIISAIVSLVVALVTVFASRNAIRAERERLERELQRNMTTRLYDVRLEVYPKAVEITEGLRKSHIAVQGKDITEDYFKNILNQLDTWHSTKAGFIISHRSLYKFYDLRNALREKPAANGKYSQQQLEKIRDAKGAFRASLRADIQLLYREEEDTEEIQDD